MVIPNYRMAVMAVGWLKVRFPESEDIAKLLHSQLFTTKMNSFTPFNITTT